MTTSKRRIPINGDDPAQAGAGAGPDGTAEQAAAGDGAARTTAGTRPAPGPAAAAQTAAPAPGAQTAGPTPPVLGAAQPDEAAAERDRLALERDALTDSLLRLRAEFDNFRRRASRELVEARERARGELLGDLLPVLDNLERALDAAEHHDERKVLTGVRMTRDMFVDLLRRSGVEEIDTVGAPFDPQVHDAMLVQPSTYAEGVVADVLERGYRQGDRVLRPARVVVSSGPVDPGEQA